MISKEDISIICNYTESESPINPNSKLTFIDFIEDDDQYQRELKMKNRSLAIDVVLDESSDDGIEYNNREVPIKIDPMMTGNGYGTLSPTIYSINLPVPSKFQSHGHLWDLVMNHIEINTQATHPFMTTIGNGFSYTRDPNKTDQENKEIRSRKLLSKILMGSNAIASTLSRVGPANFIIIGSNIIDEISPLFNSFSNKSSKSVSENKSIIGHINDLTVILSTNIKPNKIIIGRSESNKDQGGLILLNDLNNFYFTETRKTFYKRFIWFDVN